MLYLHLYARGGAGVIRIAIVEDCEADARALSDCIAAWCRAHGTEAVECAVYSDAVKFLEQAGAAADIVFMDIEMPYMSGMDAAAEFRRLNREAILIFATRATRYAVRGYAVDAIGYLVKPIKARAFGETFEKALRLHGERSRNRTVMLKTRDGVVKVNADQIRYIEAESHMLHIYADGAAHDVWSGLDKLLEQLPEEFVCCHRSYIVNLKHVGCVKKDHLFLTGQPGVPIPISRKKRPEFLDALTRYYTQTMRG